MTCLDKRRRKTKIGKHRFYDTLPDRMGTYFRIFSRFVLDVQIDHLSLVARYRPFAIDLFLLLTTRTLEDEDSNDRQLTADWIVQDFICVTLSTRRRL